MAGVGFELNRILARQGYASVIQAYSYAALIGSGPWLVAVIGLGFLGSLLGRMPVTIDTRLLFVSISFIYSITLVLTGPLQMILTRYSADQMFARRTERIFPTFVFTIAWTSVIMALLGAIVFVGFVPGPLLFRLAACFLMVVVADIWIAGIFLTALKSYRTVVLSFAGGFSVCIIAGWKLAEGYGATGALMGVACGHGLLLLLLVSAITKELGSVRLDGGALIPYFVKYWDLALGGLLYNLSIMIDKFLYWWVDPSAEVVAGILRASPVFDRVIYFSFLTIVPGMAVFLLKLETEFAEKNTLFFDHVLKKATLEQILQYKQEMIASLRSNFALLLKVQGVCTLACVAGAGYLLDVLGLGAVQAGVLQISLIGVFLLVMFLAFQTILYYLDKRRDAMWCCLVFASLNGLLTLGCIPGGDRYYGLGFLMAAAVASGIAAIRVNHHLSRVDYDTFTSQPIYG